MDLPEAIVLFGASGFVGRNIVDALRDRVGMLVGVTRSGRAVPGCSRVVAVNRLRNIPALPARTAIVNVAAFRYAAPSFGEDQPAILAANVAITDHVYRFAIERGITEVRAASSVAVYPASWAVQDDSQPLDLNAWPHLGEAPYAWSKRWGEIVADLWHRRHGIATVSFRLSNPYGPYDGLDESQVHVATAFVLRALRAAERFEVRGDPDAERDFVFTGDVAAAFLASLSLHQTHDAVNLAAGFTTTVGQLAEAAMAAAGQMRPIQVVNPSTAGVKIRRATALRLRALLPDLAPFRGVEAGMAATVDWYRHALS